jgi:hypothetical protein
MSSSDQAPNALPVGASDGGAVMEGETVKAAPVVAAPVSATDVEEDTRPADVFEDTVSGKELHTEGDAVRGDADEEDRQNGDGSTDDDKGKGKERMEDTHKARLDDSNNDNVDDETTPVDMLDMTSSVATIKPTYAQAQAELVVPEGRSRNHNNLSLRPTPYVDPTPPTPLASQPQSRSASHARTTSMGRTSSAEASPTRSEFDEKRFASEDEQDGGSRAEIQSIMDQFDEDGGPDAEAVMSPRLEITSPGGLLARTSSHPVRTSSFEASSSHVPELRSPTSPRSLRSSLHQPEERPPVPPKDSPRGSAESLRHVEPVPSEESPLSPSNHQPPLPEPEPDSVLPFDFHRFLEQLRHKKADPVARYLKSFLNEFGKRQWMVHEQVKIIGDFLAFISAKMMQCDVWRGVTDAEFDNAREGMEKLVMNRLYTQTFSPAISPPQPIPGQSRRRGGERPMGPGRRGQHQEDVERDDILAQKIQIYSWVREAHLDIAPIAADGGKRFLKLAQQELLKIRSYRAPRDKIICVLNCCKVIFGYLRHAKSDSSADSFMPLLIYIVLQANPEHLVSNVQYILRFRNQDKLGGEAGYYLSSLLGAIQFVENMDRTTLTITDEEFEKNVEAAVSAIAEKHKLESPPVAQEQFSEKPLPRNGAVETSLSLPRTSTSTQDGGDSSADEKAPMAGLFRSIQRPLSSIGRIFSEELSSTIGGSSSSQPPSQISLLPAATASLRSPRSATFMPPSPRNAPARDPSPDGRVGRPQQPGSAPLWQLENNLQQQQQQQQQHQQHRLSAEEAAARQASAEVAEAHRLHRAEHDTIVETLAGMFPDLDRDIISDVVYQKQGRVGQAVDACLLLSN